MYLKRVRTYRRVRPRKRRNSIKELQKNERWFLNPKILFWGKKKNHDFTYFKSEKPHILGNIRGNNFKPILEYNTGKFFEINGTSEENGYFIFEGEKPSFRLKLKIYK